MCLPLRTGQVTLALFLAALGIALPARLLAGDAAEILRISGIQGGLVVHVGCGDGRLTAALAANDRFLVHGLDANADHVAAARSYLQAEGLYGQVTIEQWSSDRLPYTDGLVNLIVASASAPPISDQEIQRVLCPGGVAIRLPKSAGEWKPYKKPWPLDIDQWSHFLHDATNNAVARDEQVGPPKRLRWTCGPLWSRNHEFNSSLCAMVTAGGRMFYIYDEGLTSITDSPIPERWILTARDAFNGVLLWKRPMPKWGADAWRTKALRSVPGTVLRSLVAAGDHVFLTLGYQQPVSVLDAATGEVLTTLEGTEGTQELRLSQGVLLVQSGASSITAFEAESATRLWEATGRIVPTSLAADEHNAVYQDAQTIQCLDLRTGESRWQADCPAKAGLLVLSGDLVLISTNSQLLAIARDTGENLWTAKAKIRNEFFVANDRLWHWEGGAIVGRDLGTGEIVERPDTTGVFTKGHHLRCYQSKATENYLITPNRGVEFVSTRGGESSEFDWMRGACRYGIMPGNGLLYVPPHPCFCYPGVKLTGFNAVATGKSESGKTWNNDRADRLEKGPAFDAGDVPSPRSNRDASHDWPTYRANARRTGAADTAVSGKVSPAWQVDLRGNLTPPVVADGRVFVANKDTNTLHAVDMEDGGSLWQYTADGRIDSPPTVYGAWVLFGGADGRAYCLRASDGELVWRFDAAPSDERIVAFGRLESPWRVHGTVLVEQGVAYFTAGRSSYLDGGIWIFGLNPQTGEVLHQVRLNDWNPHRVDAKGKPFVASYHMEGASSDILVAQDGFLYLGQNRFNRDLERQDVPYILADAEDKTEAMDLTGAPYTEADREPNSDYERHQRSWIENTQKEYVAELRAKFGGYSLGQRDLGLHVFSPAGFLDDSWFNRTYWMYSATWPGYYIANRAAKTGQLLVVGPDTTFAVQAFPSRNLQSPLFTPGEKGYLLFADANDNEPFLDYRTRETTKGWGYTRTSPPTWYQWTPIRIRAMVLAEDRLFVAGPPDTLDEADPMASFEGRDGALLRTCSAADGSTHAEIKLDAPPVFDGLIAAQQRLFISTTDGRLICLSGE